MSRNSRHDSLKRVLSSTHTLRVLCAVLCAVMIFGLAAPAGAVTAYAAEPAACTGKADCTAVTHDPTCLSLSNAGTGTESSNANEGTGTEANENNAPVNTCTKADDCTADVHEEGCPKYTAPVGNESNENKPADPSDSGDTGSSGNGNDGKNESTVCTGLSDCKAETHNEGCLSQQQNNNVPANIVWADGTVTGSIDGASVSVAGQLPEGAQLSITKAEGGTSDTDGNFSDTYTLSIFTLDGETKVPADTSGKSYTVTVTAPEGKEYESYTVKVGETDITVTNNKSSVSFALTGLGELAVSGKLVAAAKSVDRKSVV